MPKMTGSALAKRVREVKPDMPIIIATGHAELPPGEDDFQLLTKPFMQDDLEAPLNDALRRKSSAF